MLSRSHRPGGTLQPNRTFLAAVLAGALSLALAAAGCGSSDDNGKKKSDQPAKGEKAAPTPAAPLSAVLPPFNRAIATQNCGLYAPLALTYTRPPQAKPGSPPIGGPAKECDHYRALLSKFLRGVRFTKAQQYGTAGIAQGPGPRQGKYSNHTGVFVLDWDRKYRFYLTNASDPQIGTKPKSGTDFGKTAETFVKAVRDRDCAAFRRVTSPAGGFYRGVKSQQEACNAVFNGHFLAPQLKADPAAKALKLGETLDFGFYGIATKLNYYTMVMSTRPDDAGAQFKGRDPVLVIDYFPNYPVA